MKHIVMCLGLAGLLSLPAHAAIVTLTGSEFDVQYNTSDLGEFGTPTLSGNVLYFSPSAFTDQSVNGQGLITNAQTATGITLIAHAGFQFGNFYVNAQGDYTMTGSSSSVAVAGTLTATDAARPLTQTVTSLVLDPSQPLTIQDGQAHGWTGTASINDATPTVTPGNNPWLENAQSINISLWNMLSASTSTGSGPQQAYIQEKFAGLQLYIDPVPVPLPPALGAFLGGLALLGMGRISRRRTV